MKEFENIDEIRSSISKLRKQFEDASYLISYLEADLDRYGAYHYVDTAMFDIKQTYDELLENVNTLEEDLDDIIEDQAEDSD